MPQTQRPPDLDAQGQPAGRPPDLPAVATTQPQTATAPSGGILSALAGFGQEAIKRLAEGPHSDIPILAEAGQLPFLSPTGIANGWRLMTQAPSVAPRVAKVVGGALKGAAMRTPIVGPMVRGAVQGGMQSWKASAPAVEEAAATLAPKAAEAVAPAVETAAPAIPHGPAPKPKLSAAETAQYMRKEFGSEKGSQMLWGKTQKGAGPESSVSSAALRKEAIKRMAPGESELPGVAKTAISDKFGEFEAYLAKAPNAKAREYILQLMNKGK